MPGQPAGLLRAPLNLALTRGPATCIAYALQVWLPEVEGSDVLLTTKVGAGPPGAGEEAGAAPAAGPFSGAAPHLLQPILVRARRPRAALP